ncbi:MAG TPA: GNAT family protein [Patescibacteria group bacterium]|nr:GNAT family protein [Patescibacteria group bacterium]
MRVESTGFKTFSELAWDMKTKSMIDLETGLQLVPFNGDQLQIARAIRWSLGPEVGKYFFLDGEETYSSLFTMYSGATLNPSVGLFEITTPDNTPIGFADIAYLDTPIPSTAILIGDKSQWHHGFGSTAISMLHIRAKEAGFRRVQAKIHGDNERSLEIYQRFAPNITVVSRNPDVLYFTLDLAQWEPANPIRMVIE